MLLNGLENVKDCSREDCDSKGLEFKYYLYSSPSIFAFEDVPIIFPPMIPSKYYLIARGVKMLSSCP